MKKVILFLFVLGSLSLYSRTQSGVYLSYGISSMSKASTYNMYITSATTTFDVEVGGSFNFGAFYRTPLNESSHFNMELILSKFNSSVKYTHAFDQYNNVEESELYMVETDETKELVYLSLPVYYSYEWSGISADLGMQLMYLIDLKTTIEYYSAYYYLSNEIRLSGLNTGDIDHKIKKFDLGLMGGLNYNFNPRFSVGARFYHGLLNVMKSSIGDKNKNWQLSFGIHYAFN